MVNSGDNIKRIISFYGLNVYEPNVVAVVVGVHFN